jgi:hypothetical protein
MKCSDIPILPILQYLKDTRHISWATWRETEAYVVSGHVHPAMPTVKNVMPEGTPEKVILAKMRKLILQDLVSGCFCGCHGNFELTAKGRDFLDSSNE